MTLRRLIDNVWVNPDQIESVKDLDMYSDEGHYLGTRVEVRSNSGQIWYPPDKTIEQVVEILDPPILYDTGAL